MLVLGLVRLGMSSHSLGWGWHDCPGILWHGVGFYWGGVACGRCIVFYSKCWVRAVALGGSSLGKGFF